ncbi:MAG TPA: ABC transporter permease [Candidatus Acidoferrum sp.]|nr:ABC transporter permease [Candidatus Acidoferrum sp.]
MKSAKLISQALRSMRRYWLRTTLMMLAIVVGIASLAVLSSIGEATRRETMQRFKNMIGTFDTIIVRPGGGRSRGMPTLVNVPPTLRFEDADAIAKDLPEVKAVAEMQTAFDVDIKYRERAASPVVIGVTPNWLELRSEEMQDGLFFTEDQNASLARVAVIGTDVRAALFPEEDPSGKTLRIADVPFQVIGILKSRGAGPAGGSLDNLVLIPVNTASRRLFNRDFLTMVIAQIKDPEHGSEATERVTALLRERHHIQPAALDDFTITNPAATMAQVTRAGNTLTKILTGVAAMALLVGGVVIMSLMSIAVSERWKEIGVRRSVGATRGDIVAQFLLEATLVATAGGIAGAMIGWVGMQLATRMQTLPQILVWRPFAGAILVSVTVGLVFGIYPAWKASRLDPIRALRS